MLKTYGGRKAFAVTLDNDPASQRHRQRRRTKHPIGLASSALRTARCAKTGTMFSLRSRGALALPTPAPCSSGNKKRSQPGLRGLFLGFSWTAAMRRANVSKSRQTERIQVPALTAAQIGLPLLERRLQVGSDKSCVANRTSPASQVSGRGSRLNRETSTERAKFTRGFAVRDLG
jgi:hypothetical protein